MSEKKMGRPTTNPKTAPIHVRLDNECVEILDKYTEQNQVTRVEAIRRGIKRLKDSLKEE